MNIRSDKVLELIDRVKTSSSRLWVQIKLNKHLPDIAEYYHTRQAQSTSGSAEFHKAFTELQILIREDFVKTKKRDWIDIFLEHSVSPLSLRVILDHLFVDDNLPPLEPSLTRVEKFLQRTQNRSNLHRQSFISEPQTSISAAIYHLYPNNGNPFHSRMQLILKKLMNSNAVISNRIHHWTTMSNLQSILWEGKIYANKHLKDLKKYFQKNSLGTRDIENGDGDVICFAPYLIDPVALVDEEKNTLKNDLVRLSIDIEKSPYHWEMQHFFKIRDLGIPSIDYKVKIDANLSFEFLFKRQLKGEMFITIKLGKLEFKHGININGGIFYGNYFAINQFCMDQLPRILKHADSHFLDAFNSYLSTLTDNGIKKIFVIFAQSLTIYCEYNVNHKLKLRDHMITDIYLVNENQHFDLSSLTIENYQATCEQIKSSASIPLEPIQYVKPLVEFDGHYINIYDTQIWYRQRSFNLAKDFSDLNPDNFNEGYYETRPGLDTKVPVIENNNNKRFGFM